METIVLSKKQNQALLNLELNKYDIAILTPDNSDTEIYGALLSLNYNVIEARNKYIHDYGDIEKIFNINENSLLILNVNYESKIKFIENLTIISKYCGDKFLLKSEKENQIWTYSNNEIHPDNIFAEWKPSFINNKIPKQNIVKVVDFVSLMDNIKTRNIMGRWSFSKSRDKIFSNK